MKDVLKLIKKEQSRFLKKRKELLNQGNYDEYKMGVLVGRLAELEGLKLLLEEKSERGL